MSLLINVITWIFGIVFLIASIGILGMGGKVQFPIILLIALLLIPPIRSLLNNLFSKPLPWWAFAITIIVLWSLMLVSFKMNPAESIYRYETAKTDLLKIYDEQVANWPSPYEDIYVDTQYGKLHAIVSGPEDGYPVILINASAMSGWSWIYNVGTLNRKFRTYAIDNIGEGGKSEIYVPNQVPKTSREIADFYKDITTKLGIEESHVMGASIGGYISSCYAAHYPERVNRLVLLGPMGYGHTNVTIMAMMIAQAYPLKPIQDATFKWAFGNAPHLLEDFGDWFYLTMKGLIPTPIPPSTLDEKLLMNLTSPTMAYFGTKDNVVGDHKIAEKIASSIPNIRINIVETGHMIGAEIPQQINNDIYNFFTEAHSDDAYERLSQNSIFFPICDSI